MPLFSEIDTAIRRLAPDRCRQVAVAAATRALDAWPERPDAVVVSLRQVQTSGIDDTARAEIVRIADHLDERYLHLHDDQKPGGRSIGWEAAFRRARAAAAVVSALDEDPYRAASNALYEASYAIDEDLTELARQDA